MNANQIGNRLFSHVFITLAGVFVNYNHIRR